MFLADKEIFGVFKEKVSIKIDTQIIGIAELVTKT